MISIVVCSKNKILSSNLYDNIYRTIGYEFEFYLIENFKNEFSIFSAYNKGIRGSKGRYICFVHEDVLFHTKEWGKVLVDIFQSDSNIGLIGIAGSKIKTKNISGWWDSPMEALVKNLLQHNNGRVLHENIGFGTKTYSQVAVIDGVFMAVRRNSFISYFDENLMGFHCYDLNLSINSILSGFKNIVINQILIEHFSIGDQNESWYTNSFTFHKKYSKYLPIKTGSFINYKIDEIENANAEKVLNNLLRYNLTCKTSTVWLNYFIQRPFSLFHIKYLLKLGIKYFNKL